jgi:hypothetical protein
MAKSCSMLTRPRTPPKEIMTAPAQNMPGHGMVTAWSRHSHGMVTAWSRRHGHGGMVTAWSRRHGHGMVTAWSRHAHGGMVTAWSRWNCHGMVTAWSRRGRGVGAGAERAEREVLHGELDRRAGAAVRGDAVPVAGAGVVQQADAEDGPRGGEEAEEVRVPCGTRRAAGEGRGARKDETKGARKDAFYVRNSGANQLLMGFRSRGVRGVRGSSTNGSEGVAMQEGHQVAESEWAGNQLLFHKGESKEQQWEAAVDPMKIMMAMLWSAKAAKVTIGTLPLDPQSRQPR